MGSARLGGDVAALGASSEIACGSEPGAPWAAAASVVGAPCGSGSPCGLKSILIVGAEALASSEPADCEVGAEWGGVSRSMANAGMSGIVGALDRASLLSAPCATGSGVGVGGLGFALGAADGTTLWSCGLGLPGELLVAGATPRGAPGFADWLVLDCERLRESETGSGGGVPSRLGLLAGESACRTGTAAAGAVGG